jgi:hypothetical protein
MTNTMARRIGVLMAIALLGATLSVVTATPAAACGSRSVRQQMKAGALEVMSLRTFHLEVKGDKPLYNIGEVAKIHVTVTRPAHEDPLGQGIPLDPPMSFPAEGVNVGVGLRVGEVFLFGHNITDAEGHTIVKVKIEKYAQPGPASADIYAWKSLVDLPCLRVEENGYTQAPKIFTVPRGRGR